MLRSALRTATATAGASTSRLVATPAVSTSVRPSLSQASKLAAVPTVSSNRLYHEKVIDHVSVQACLHCDSVGHVFAVY